MQLLFLSKVPQGQIHLLCCHHKKGSSKRAAFLIFATWSKYIMYLRSIWIVSEDIKSWDGSNYDNGANYDTTIKLFEVILLLVSNFIRFSSLDRYFAVTRPTERQMAVVAQYWKIFKYGVKLLMSSIEKYSNIFWCYTTMVLKTLL